MSAGVIAAHYVAAGAGTTYDAAVMADSPAMYLKLEDASGTTATDSSGNGHHVPASGITWGQPSLLTDGTGTSASFNGSSSILSLPAVSATWMDSASFTYSARIKWDGTQQWIGGRWGNGGNTPWLFWISTAGKLTLFVDGVATGPTGATSLVSGTNYTVACRANGTTLQVFLNGVSDGSVNHAGPTQTNSPFEVGRASLATFETLRAQKLAFWTSAISDARLAAHHAAA